MKKILLFLFALATMATQAQNPGDIAQNFGTTYGFNGSVYAIATQSDGKILVGGNFTTYKGVSEIRIIRLNSDGTKDSSFTTGTGFSGTVRAIATQANGKLLVVGEFSTYNGVIENRIIRLNNDGSKDTTFVTGTGFNDTVLTITTQADGKILVGGIFTTYNGVTENRIIRLNNDGSKDATFVTGTGFNDFVRTIATQTDGKILVGGRFTTYKGVTEIRIIRLNSDGSKDATFVTGTGFDGTVFSIVTQADGNILIGGNFSTYKGVTEIRIIRLNSNGTKDATFGTGTGFNDIVNEITIKSDGKILVGGDFTTYNGVTVNRIIQLNSDGSKDATFVTGTGFNGTVFRIVPQADGNILIGGSFTAYNGVTEIRIIRLNSNGTKDATFVTGTGFSSSVYSIATQSDGKILVGGLFNTYKGVTENRIIRLNSDGSKDATFVTGTGFNSFVYSIATQADGKILVGGDFTIYNGVTENRIIRLNSDGSKDTSFNPGTGFNSTVWTIVSQADGKILVGGDFITYNGVTENRIIRLNSDGSKDATFVTGTGFNNTVRAIAIQTDGKILVGGSFSTYNGVTENRIIRLNNDGSKDATFVTGTGFNTSVWKIVTQADGKILVGGDFTTYNGITENRIIRLNTDGSKDSTFITGTGFNFYVNSITTQTDGKIVVGGDFTTYKSITENRIVCLNADGSKDTAFITGTGFDSRVQTITLKADGKILVGGDFITYKGDNSSAYLIGLHSEASLSTTSFDTANAFVIYPNPVQDVLHLQANNFTTIKGVKIYNLQGKVVLEDTNDTINVSNLSKGLYIVKIITEEGEVTKKFIKE
jgi:uncharacterized delta-60 repeat protein